MYANIRKLFFETSLVKSNFSLTKFLLLTFLLFFSVVNEIISKSRTPLDNARGKQSICYQVFDEEILPKINQDGLFEIGIGIAPISIREITPENNLAEIDFYLTIEYDIEKNLPNVKCVGNKSSKVWDIFFNPDIEFMTISGPEYLQGDHWMIENKKFAFMTRVRGKVELNGNFRYFPFDTLSIKVTVSGEDNSKAVLLKPSIWYHSSLSNFLSEFQGIQIPGWTLSKAFFKKYEPSSSEIEKGYWDELTLHLEIKREPLTSFMRTTLPLLILYLITFFSFLLRNNKSGMPAGNDKFTETRMSIQVGSLLALFAYSLYIMEVIPETSYLTLGDLGWLTFMVSTLLVIFSEYIPNNLIFYGRNINFKFLSLFMSASLVFVLVVYQTILYLTWD